MSYHNSELTNSRLNYGASALLLLGSILFLIGSGISFFVTRDQHYGKVREYENHSISGGWG
ncbi:MULTISPECIES: hypothetical protein [Bacillaceae]|uniref:hypothetical protein n=1 Tax=Bacillaceae TaxID=186817 RepID=UPI00047E80BA|nr:MULTISPECIES: hypothetical protein [Bacillaceae]UOE95288.1 hypothetical protein MM271_06615 [Alkalihalobacillus sp. LMS39]